MATLPHTTTDVQFDAASVSRTEQALRGLAERARTRYAGEAARIDRGLVIALNGGVSLKADGTPLVSSTRDDEVFYIVRDGHCDCPDAPRAPEGRCKHRWAACFVRKARTLALRYEAVRYFATYVDPAGEAHQGIATQTGSGWLFVSDDGLDPLFASSAALALGGRVDLYEAQKEADGDLVKKVCFGTER